MKSFKYIAGGLAVLAMLSGCRAQKTVTEIKDEDPKVEETKGNETVTLKEDCKYEFAAREEGKEFWTQAPDECIVTASEGDSSMAFAKNQLVATFEDLEKLPEIEKFFEGKGYAVTGLVGLEANQVRELQVTSIEDKTYDELLKDVIAIQEEGKELITSLGLNILAADSGADK